MRTTLYFVVLCSALVAVYAAPAASPEANPEANPAANPDPAAAAANDDRPEIIEIIAPAASAQVPEPKFKKLAKCESTLYNI